MFGCGVYLFVEGAELWGGEVGEGGGVDEGVGEFVYGADFGGDGVACIDLVERAQACGGVDEFVEAGHGDGADDGGAFVEAGEHGAEEGDALDEGDGAVDGVDDPLVVVGAWLVRELFAEDGVVWEVCGDSFAEFGFDGFVGDGDGGAVGFLVWGEGVLAEPLECEFGAGDCVGCGEVEAGLKVGLEFFGHHGIFLVRFGVGGGVV